MDEKNIESKKIKFKKNGNKLKIPENFDTLPIDEETSVEIVIIVEK